MPARLPDSRESPFRLFPPRSGGPKCFEIDIARMAELEQFDAFVTDRIGVGRGIGQEEAITCSELLGAKLNRAGNDIVKAILLVAVARQRIVRLEPNIDE